MAHCEASAIFLFPIDLKLLGHLFLSISLPHAKMQPHLPSNYLIMIFQSFCPDRSFVKKVQARHIQMSCNFARFFIWSNNDSPPNLSSCNLSMWTQLQILDSGQIFSLWITIFYIASIALKLYQDMLLPISTPSTKF